MPLRRIWDEARRILEEGRTQTGRLIVGKGRNGEQVVQITGRHEIDPDWLEVPLILLDATPEPMILSHWFGELDHPTVHAEEPHVTVRQCTERSFAKSMLDDSPGERGRIACPNNRRRLARLVREKARDGDVLLIGNKGVIDKLRAEHDLPDNVAFGWFNALRGLDRFGSVRHLIVVGRPQPSTEDLARMASAVTGDVEDHRGETVVTLLRSIRDAEVEQAIGRARGVNRTSDTPLDVLVLGKTPLRRPTVEVPLGEVWRAETPAERMIETGGVVLESPADAAKAYPDLWASRQAAAYDMTRNVIKLPDDDFCHVMFRRPRCRERARAWVDRRHSDPRAAVEALVGPLAEFRIVPGKPV